MTTLLILLLCTIALRIVSLLKSISNEEKLKKNGATEYGITNSKILVAAHILYYASCITESIIFERSFNHVTIYGIELFLFSTLMLWIVIFSLKDIWTVKLIIAPNQRVNKSLIFKYFRHPNYFLNIIPELVAVALIGQAWYTLIIGLPLYLIPLGIRISQEEKVMKMHFSDY